MKPEEARFILAAVRPPSDAADPTPSTPQDPNVAEAVRVMESDSELKTWYAEHCHFDRAVADQVSAIEPPSDLESNILAGLKVSGLIPWWQRGTFRVLAVAASVMLIAAVTYTARQGLAPGTEKGIVAENANDFRRSVVGEIKNLQSFDYMSDQSGQLVAWLSQQGSPTLANLDLPSNIGDAKVAGCKLLEWKGHRVSLMCFLVPDAVGDERSFHLVVVDGKAFPGVRGDHPLIVSEDGWSTALWRQGSKIVLIATDNPNPDELRNQRQQIPFTEMGGRIEKPFFIGNKPPIPPLLLVKRSVAT